jgi:hypothetical protein
MSAPALVAIESQLSDVVLAALKASTTEVSGPASQGRARAGGTGEEAAGAAILVST